MSNVNQRIITPPSRDVDKKTIEDIYRHINKFYNGVEIPVISGGGGSSGSGSGGGSSTIVSGIAKISTTIYASDAGSTVNIGGLNAWDVPFQLVVVIINAFNSDNEMYLKDSAAQILGTQFFRLSDVEINVYTIPVKEYTSNDYLSLVISGSTTGSGKARVFVTILRD